MIDVDFIEVMTAIVVVATWNHDEKLARNVQRRFQWQYRDGVSVDDNDGLMKVFWIEEDT